MWGGCGWGGGVEGWGSFSGTTQIMRLMRVCGWACRGGGYPVVLVTLNLCPPPLVLRSSMVTLTMHASDWVICSDARNSWDSCACGEMEQGTRVGGKRGVHG